MVEFKVTGMTCGGCVNSVKKAIARLDPQAVVEVDLPTGRVTVDGAGKAEGQNLSRAALEKAIVGAGFSVEAT